MRRALLVLAVPLAVPAAAPARDVRRYPQYCWEGPRAYAFPYRASRFRTPGARDALPLCRQALRGTIDFTPPRVRITGYSAFKSTNPGVFAADDPARTFSVLLRPQPGRPAGAPRVWPLRDSLGHVFATVSQQRLPDAMAPLRVRRGGELFSPIAYDDRWIVRYPDGGVYGFSDNQGLRLLIQGRACMVNDPLEDANPMVVLFGGAHGKGPHAFGTAPFPGPVSMGVRGFLPVRALPARGIANPQSPLADRDTATIVDTFHSGCNQYDTTTLQAPWPPERTTHRSLVPLFSWSDQYASPRATADSSTGGSRLTNYQGWPDPKQDLPSPPGQPVPARPTGRADIVREVKLMQSTTAVNGGGLVRAVVPADARFVQLDHFAYADPNVLCQAVGGGRVEASTVATWTYVRVVGTRIEGWVPHRVRPQVKRCKAGAVGKPPPGW